MEFEVTEWIDREDGGADLKIEMDNEAHDTLMKAAKIAGVETIEEYLHYVLRDKVKEGMEDEQV